MCWYPSQVMLVAQGMKHKYLVKSSNEKVDFESLFELMNR